MESREEQRTANPDHLLPPSLIPLDERHDDWGSKIPEPRSYGPHDADIAIVCKLGDFGVVFLEDTKGEWEAYAQQY
jgi:hypothetical protein